VNTFTRTDISSDLYAQRTNPISSIDARVKMAFIIAALVINLLSLDIWAPISIAVVCMAALLLIKIPPRLLLLRLSLPLVMASIVLITQTFMSGGNDLFFLNIGGFHVTAYKEGLDKGLLIMWRVIAGVSLILFLGLSTPANKLLFAARWFRMPAILVELLLLIYRYVFVLLDEMIIIRESQIVRMGYRNWRQSMNSISILGASLIFRAYDRAERVYDAMLVRGYTGGPGPVRSKPLNKADCVTIFIFTALLAALYVLGQLPK